jgi:hypothetical protein
MAKEETPQFDGLKKEVDKLYGLVKEIADLKSEASVLESSLKEKGSKILRDDLEKQFGSINLVGTEAIGQIQVRRASVSIPSDKIEEVKKLLGERFDAFFDVKTDVLNTEHLLDAKKAEVKKLILAAKLDPSDFFSSVTVVKTASANDNWLDIKKRSVFLKGKEKLFEAVNKLADIRGSIEGVLALSWKAKKE